MRVLFTTYPERTIFQPMVPLAWALRTAGHDVRVASQPSFAGEITQAGLTAVPIGRQHTNTLRRLAEANPELAEAERVGLPSPYDAAAPGEQPITFDRMVSGYRNVLEIWHKQNNFPLITGLVEFARQWEPDLIIWEPHTYAGPIAAKACGAAHGRLLWSVDIFGVTRERFLDLKPDQGPDPLADWLGSYGRRYGFEFSEDMATGQFSIDPLPESIRLDSGLDKLPMRYVPYNGAAVAPSWLRTPPAKPRVALTLGTSATEIFTGYTVSVQDILDALAGLDVEIVATVAESKQGELERVPDGTRLVSYVPLHDLAPTCSVIVNHAGPGTVLTTAVNATPQLTMPYEFDEPELARQVAQRGAALTVVGDQDAGRGIRDNVLRLLSEPSFAADAAGLAAEMAALPSPNELVEPLEQLATKYRA
ncbi:activator-dependent family glycosyltransferase [Amycolatopsis suaedae]|uniref:Activator-dependent family glycosyltransferase n=1 Tax=Amycolatopsis suaedae TaxID=2510978 RepID=A0A4Q7J196_9PSEU|nr:activator-dependent family glycosyltransferase [Amycolatopsis suaedae]RZQ61160.1 activator-dependent family glycosyltransferase [Amycolatopsis suaedae]